MIGWLYSAVWRVTRIVFIFRLTSLVAPGELTVFFWNFESTRTVWIFTRMHWCAPRWFECLPRYLEKYSDWSYIARVQLLQAWYLLGNRIFSSSNKFKGYKIINLTRPIKFDPSNRSTSNKESSGIRPLSRLIYNKNPSCYKVEHTLLGLLFPLWEYSASKTGVSGAILPGLLGLEVICMHLSTQASFAMITWTRDWLQVNRVNKPNRRTGMGLLNDGMCPLSQGFFYFPSQTTW
jgi:hypothetical protein